jgi:hypothetical protein
MGYDVYSKFNRPSSRATVVMKNGLMGLSIPRSSDRWACPPHHGHHHYTGPTLARRLRLPRRCGLSARSKKKFWRHGIDEPGAAQVGWRTSKWRWQRRTFRLSEGILWLPFPAIKSRRKSCICRKLWMTLLLSIRRWISSLFMTSRCSPIQEGADSSAAILAL